MSSRIRVIAGTPARCPTVPLWTNSRTAGLDRCSVCLRMADEAPLVGQAVSVQQQYAAWDSNPARRIKRWPTVGANRPIRGDTSFRVRGRGTSYNDSRT